MISQYIRLYKLKLKLAKLYIQKALMKSGMWLLDGLYKIIVGDK